MIARASVPSGIQFEIIPPGKAARPIEAIAEDEGKECRRSITFRLKINSSDKGYNFSTSFKIPLRRSLQELWRVEYG